MDQKEKTIIAGFSLNTPWKDVFRNLNDPDGPLDICYWVYGNRSGGIEQSKALFPKVMFHEARDAVQSIGALTIPQPCFDEQQLIELSRFEPIAIQMMDRVDPDNCFSYAERRRHYQRLLKYWSAVLTHYQPSLVIFPNAPHMVYDYVIYILAKQSNIKTVMLNVNSALGRIMLGSSIEDFCDRVKNAYEQNTPAPQDPQLVQVIDQHVATLKQDYDVAKPHYMTMLEESNQKFSFSFDPIKLAKSVYWRSVVTGRELKRHIKLRIRSGHTMPDNYVKKHGSPLEQSSYNEKEWRSLKRREFKKKRLLKETYTSLSDGPVDLSVNYVYVPLHYQPETTTCPEGGYYMNQALMLDMISTLLPDDWHVYVKEHPLQWQQRVSKGHQSRTPQDYIDLAALPKVRLIPVTMNSFDLMDSSKILATVLGYAAWEAMVRGKPAFLFGNPWFGGHDNAYLIKTQRDFVDAFKKVMSNDKSTTDEQSKAYLAAYFSVSFFGRTNKWNKDVSDLSDEQNIDNFIRAFKSYLS